MLTMTRAEAPAFRNHFARIHVSQDAPCINMKCNDQWGVQKHFEHDLTSSEQKEIIEEIIESLEMIELNYGVENETDWKVNDSSKRTSRHLSGGGLMEKPLRKVSIQPIKSASNCSGSVVSTPQDEARNSKNPFLNHLRLELDDNSDSRVDLPKQGCVFPPTNPFSYFNNSSLYANEESPKLKRTLSQCSTRAVSPVENPQRPRSFTFLTNDEVHRVKKSMLKSPTNPFNSVPRQNVSLPVTDSKDQCTQTLREPTWLHGDRQIQKTIAALRLSGWYYENVSWQDSKILLQDSEPGTFLVRDSADPYFLFSLSIQTSRGPTSVRLHFENDRFRLDAEEKLIPNMPTFETVLQLLEFYMSFSTKRHKSKRKHSVHVTPKDQVWVDTQGHVFSNILLTKPLRKPDKVNSLKHLCRLTVCDSLRKSFYSRRSNSLASFPVVPITKLIDSLTVPPLLNVFLKDYPYSQ